MSIFLGCGDGAGPELPAQDDLSLLYQRLGHGQKDAFKSRSDLLSPPGLWTGDHGETAAAHCPGDGHR